MSQTIDLIEQHLKTHSERSAEDIAAVSKLKALLVCNGKIATNFSENDKWPNIDGTFEYVQDPNISRFPKQNFFVQIKGTGSYNDSDGIIKYTLKTLSFPAYIHKHVTYDPGILFVVLNPTSRDNTRIFWKYMSTEFLNSINYEHKSITITFSQDEEIKNTNESVNIFCEKLNDITNKHTFINQIDDISYTPNEIENIIKNCDKEICKSIEKDEILNSTRDDISRRILSRLQDLCTATLILNAMKYSHGKVNLRFAWEYSLLNIETKYLGSFYKALKFIGRRIPEEGQSERLMLKYYDFLWQIRNFLKDQFNYNILQNLENFPINTDLQDETYYKLISERLKDIKTTSDTFRDSRYYIQKKTPFYIGTERYYEITLQLAGVYATKYNRITAYTKDNISTNYSIQIDYVDKTIDLWGIDTKIKIITNWRVSIDPLCLNKIGKILHMPTKLNSRHREYLNLMDFLTRSGINLLELIDLKEIQFKAIIDEIYSTTKTEIYKEILLKLKNNYSSISRVKGRNTIRYLLINLKEEIIKDVLPNKFTQTFLSDKLHISSKCFPFEKNPYISNLAGRKTSDNNLKQILDVAGIDKMDLAYPYIYIKKNINETGEIYYNLDKILTTENIARYNLSLDEWEKRQGYEIIVDNSIVSINSYEKSTLFILKKLLELSHKTNKGQKEINQKFIEENPIRLNDDLKKQAIKNIFIDSQILLIYGAAGTGKTTLINIISNLLGNRKKLFLTKTHTALQNLKRRIENPGTRSSFISIDSFTQRISVEEFDIIFIDECSTIDNKKMQEFLKKINPNAFIVMAGDIYQIESIDFGNWFFYAKDIIKNSNANIELLNTWRTDDESLIGLWDEVRNSEELITEKLVINGPYSEEIGANILERSDEDEVILCLNYDGKFGLNNMNNYFQSSNTKSEAITWQEWSYKAGDPILFNDCERFSLLYNNLKGRIIHIQKAKTQITFIIDIETILTENDCEKEEFDFIDIVDGKTRIKLTIYAYDNNVAEEDFEMMRLRSVIPFQLAYAISIHKAQGLEYDSVKVIIPRSNSEKITHGIFYTAITRAKRKLKIFWSSETMKDVIEKFGTKDSKKRSLEIVKTKLAKEQ